MNNQTDNFEAIAKNAVDALVAVTLTLRIMGEDELAAAVADSSLRLIDRAIAIGGK